ncbi:MAG: hypothetical protein E7619_08630 [Ruminococcaceae bacterium]|nr:hypothetical protein [Oscillospiraceae bacterium]
MYKKQKEGRKMNKEIIPVSPIIDHTEEAVLTGNRKKKSRAKAKQAFAYVISAMLSANLLLCSWGYIKENISSESFGDKLIYEIYYGGMLKKPTATTPQSPDTVAKDTAPSLPVAAEPYPPNVDEANQNQTNANEVAEAFVKLYEYDPSLVPEGTYPIIPYDLSSEADGELKIFNDTEFSVDINALAKSEALTSGTEYTEEPLVLIVHTHGTEAYSEPGVMGYSETFNIPRSYDVSKNVIHIGKIMARVMNENGINTIQCDVMHDAESYLGAYERSAETVKDYLQRYPSIKYVFDIHRDSVLLEDKTKTRPITIADGKVAAQIMTVVGSNELGTYHPDWENNLRFAAKLQTMLNSDHLGLARAICLRGSAYNQELAPCSLLFEVGSCGNTLEEAEVSARILAEKLCELIIKGW